MVVFATSALANTVRPGDTITGDLGSGDLQLESDCYYDEYEIDAAIGAPLIVTQESEDFDCYLIVINPDGTQYENDNFGYGTDSRVVVMIRESGTYSILCTSYFAEETGEYELSVEEKTRPNYYGVFIGIEMYIGFWEDAPLCDTDAEQLYDAFVDSGLMDPSNGIVLTNRNAETDEVADSIDELAPRITEDDVFIFFFSGHGGRIKATRSAGKISELDCMDETITLRDDDIVDHELAEMLDRIDAGLTVVVLDSCHSGGVAEDVVNGPNRVCYASSEEDVLSDFAPEFNAGGYLSVFFREAIEGSADLDGDGMIMMGELTRYLLHRYTQEVPDHDSAFYGYQELVHLRGVVPQDTIFCWFEIPEAVATLN